MTATSDTEKYTNKCKQNFLKKLEVDQRNKYKCNIEREEEKVIVIKLFYCFLQNLINDSSSK
jgi:hypothetical protein